MDMYLTLVLFLEFFFLEFFIREDLSPFFLIREASVLHKYISIRLETSLFIWEKWTANLIRTGWYDADID